MHEFSQELRAQVSKGQNTTLTAPNVSRRVETSLRLLKASCQADGLDLIPSEPVTNEDVVKAAALIEQNSGTTTADAKWMMLAQMIVEEGWSRERFQRTLKHLLKSHKWQSWTLADWFSFGIEVHPYSWYMEQVHARGATVNDSIECYRLPDGTVCYRYADTQRLPFPRKMVREKEWTE